MSSKTTNSEPISLAHTPESNQSSLPPLQMVPSTQICESLQPISPIRHNIWIRNRYLYRVTPIMPVSHHLPFGPIRVSSTKMSSIDEIPRSLFGGDGIRMPIRNGEILNLSIHGSVGPFIMKRAKHFTLKVSLLIYTIKYE